MAASDEQQELTLKERLRRRIAAAGPITFAEFMERALYEPGEGFYSRLPVGEHGHFVTSPHLSPVFGRLVARQVAEFWELLDRPSSFDVVELGAGDGTLAQQILSELPEEPSRVFRYTAVERSRAARDALEMRGFQAVASLEELPDRITGCVLANELLDNLPFHRVTWTVDGLAELYVGLDDEEFVLVEGPLSSPALAAHAPALGPGEEAQVSPASFELIDRIAQTLDRGFVWLADYGFVGEEGSRSVHGYRLHRVHADVLTDPGTTDITAGVDFAAVMDRARANGLDVWGPVSQRDALLSLGFRELDQAAQARQVDALNNRRGIDALRIYSERNRANILLGREGLGAAWVLCLGKDVDRRPSSVNA